MLPTLCARPQHVLPYSAQASIGKGLLHVPVRELGRSWGGLGLGPGVLRGVAVGCVGRNAVLLDLIL